MGYFRDLNPKTRQGFLNLLISLSFWRYIALGLLFITQIWYVFHARWPTIIRRQCEHFLSVFPWLFLLFLPLFVFQMIGERDFVEMA